MKNTFRFFGLSLMVVLAFSCDNVSESYVCGIHKDTLEVAKVMMQNYVDQSYYAGISTLVLKDGEEAFRSLHGYSNLENGFELQENDLFRIFSMSKPITAAALMVLYDEGKFQLDDPVSKYIPEFKDMTVWDGEAEVPVEREITVRHLLTHTSGLVYGWGKGYVDSCYSALEPNMWEAASLEDFVKMICEIPLKNQPGTKYEYSVSIDMVGYLIEVLSGQKLDEFMKERIFDPLGMDDTGFWVPEEKHSRLSMIYADFEGDKMPMEFYVDAVKEPVALLSGGGGLVSSIEDYGKFGQMLINEGALNGVRILEDSSVYLMMTDQLPEGVVYKDSVAYGLGGSVDLRTGEYHWAGMASTGFWADSENDMVVLVCAQFVPNMSWQFATYFKDKVREGLRE